MALLFVVKLVERWCEMFGIGKAIRNKRMQQQAQLQLDRNMQQSAAIGNPTMLDRYRSVFPPASDKVRFPGTVIGKPMKKPLASNENKRMQQQAQLQLDRNMQQAAATQGVPLQKARQAAIQQVRQQRPQGPLQKARQAALQQVQQQRPQGLQMPADPGFALSQGVMGKEGRDMAKATMQKAMGKGLAGAGLGSAGKMFKKGGKVKAKASSASKKADGVAIKGKTKGRFV